MEVVNVSPVRVIGEQYFAFLSYQNIYESIEGYIKNTDEKTIQRKIRILKMLLPTMDFSYDKSREVFIIKEREEVLCISYDLGDSWRFVRNYREQMKTENLGLPEELWESRE